MGCCRSPELPEVMGEGNEAPLSLLHADGCSRQQLAGLGRPWGFRWKQPALSPLLPGFQAQPFQPELFGAISQQLCSGFVPTGEEQTTKAIVCLLQALKLGNRNFFQETALPEWW